ncbi:hypothetical protein SAMN02745206_00693 [Desulfacinum infernum DSM 9756]|uniref:Uncharacterized protein n=1 Tax=Desulfacinum infernum DSM 9756 TaxID=1121391 RepID=A0A1M4VL08_9BACT|nr:hypothetical protein SAMN02745206_00693 [Desulfacinum infernum DSM 9756]
MHVLTPFPVAQPFRAAKESPDAEGPSRISCPFMGFRCPLPAGLKPAATKQSGARIGY